MRHLRRTVVVTATVVSWSCARQYHFPGWKTSSSTKDARTREQREKDRKARQIEKLPRPEALHDFQYPYEKTVLSDYMFQHPVYENELDTPALFNLTPPPDFFLYWNASDFERTAYPPVPEVDHRLLVPSESSPEWVAHRTTVTKYLRKHHVCPNYIPQCSSAVNLSVVYPGQYHTRARLDEDGSPLPLPDPVTELTPRNFWFTAHCGNYVELTDLQQHPSIFFTESAEAQKENALYTMLMVSPDFPYRVPPTEDRGDEDRGFFLHYMVSNLPGGAVSAAKGRATSLEAKKGDVVIPYVAPLPTEDAGTTRHLCVLIKQTAKVPVTTLTLDQERAHFPLAARSDFRLHHDSRSRDGDDALPACLSSLRRVERALVDTPCAVTFFQTKWDIQVQEYYERIGLPEPALPLDDEVEGVLAFHALRPEELRIRSRHREDGSTNMGDEASNFWSQRHPVSFLEGTMNKMWSRRTQMAQGGRTQR